MDVLAVAITSACEAAQAAASSLCERALCCAWCAFLTLISMWLPSHLLDLFASMLIYRMHLLSALGGHLKAFVNSLAPQWQP